MSPAEYHLRLCIFGKMLAIVQEGLEIVIFGTVEIPDMASQRLSVVVPLVFAVRTRFQTTEIFNPVAEPLPAVHILLATSSPSDIDQLPCRSSYLPLTLLGIEVILGLGPDQLEGFAAFFTLPCVELYLTNTMFHVETKIIGKVPRSIQHRMVGFF